ncbi:Hypothetical predicted protein [Cloeon dipterum]|uniref:RanBD1 domain-containing protein n=2 Tax=Cloeon dipterum TaxID=197152 RepID=A0A8S1CCG4_9INSE|nr:Hypothetical predicted protein [Cloeon dipterum]
MSKRRPTSELNHDNWDQEDEEKETAGQFKQASSEVLQARKVLSAKRKSAASSGENAQKTPFAAFTGFSSSTPAAKPNFSFVNSTPANKTNGQQQQEKKQAASAEDYYHQLKSLNVSVSSWISKHVQSNPYCILTPVFRDYEKHLANIEKKKPLLPAESETADSSSVTEGESTLELKTDAAEVKKDDPPPPAAAPEAPPDKEEPKVEEKKVVEEKPEAAAGVNIFGSMGKASTFSFGSAKPSTAAQPNSFVFGITNPSTTSLFGSNPSPFGGASLSGTSAFGFGNKPASSTFSFGSTEPAFSFSNIAKKPEGGEGENTEEAEEAEEPPKVEFNTFKEDDSIFDIKCKMFVLKDKEYKERGLGQLFIKRKDSESKSQLLIRSSGATGQILLNVLLNSSLDPKRVGKNNVQMACIALPTDKEPSVVMVRVKTGEDADSLLQKIKDNQM